jgi:2-polyprenyl-3-methyl-5-hydroxy-6-metoxy-1,4-benzoquinol methylase
MISEAPASQACCCEICGSDRVPELFRYDAPPEGETRFSFSHDGAYARCIVRCDDCGHLMSRHNLPDADMYSHDYVESTYQGTRFAETFQRIIALSDSQSDNAGRCRRIVEFASTHFNADNRHEKPLKILDVGSGLCVFLHRMKSLGWQCTALDPDPRAAAHARHVVGVDAVNADFFDVQGLGRYHVITFNKVLEHVKDPLLMLMKSQQFLEAGGFVYIELPDGQVASQHGQDRQEFFIEHHHIFSFASLALMVSKAGFQVQLQERLHEPSGKYTLRAFCTVRN